MTTRALVYGGVQIVGIVSRVSATYDGVSIEHRGSTFKAGKYENAGATIHLNAHEALNLALMLIRAAEKHGHDAQRDAAALIKRMAKSSKEKSNKVRHD